MANLNGINIRKARIGANTLSAGDTTSGFISTGIGTNKLALDTPITFFNLTEAENLGFTKEFDVANKVAIHRHISEFFRIAPEGAQLHFMVVAKNTTMSEICETKAKKLLPFAKGEIRQLAISVNPETTPVMLNGIPKEVFDAIPKAQGLYNWAYKNNMPCQIFLEGFGYSGTASATQNLRNITNLEASKVSIFIGQDYNYTKNRTGQQQKIADIGSFLGLASRALVNQNLGDNKDPNLNLTDATKQSWLIPALSSHSKNSEIFEDLQILEDKGFVFGVEYNGLSGVRINGDHVCTPIKKDANNAINEHSIALGRVADKAVRELRVAFLPYVKTNWPVDPKTGKLPPAVVEALNDVGDRVFQNMQKREEITFGETKVDKQSDLLTEKTLGVNYTLIPRGSVNEIKGVIDLKTQL